MNLKNVQKVLLKKLLKSNNIHFERMRQGILTRNLNF